MQLLKMEELNTTHTVKMPCEDKGRDWNDASTSKGMPKTAANQELREAWADFVHIPQKN